MQFINLDLGEGYTPSKRVRIFVKKSIDSLEKVLTIKEMSGFLRREGLHEDLTFYYEKLCEIWQTVWKIEQKEKMGVIFENMEKDKEDTQKNYDTEKRMKTDEGDENDKKS